MKSHIFKNEVKLILIFNFHLAVVAKLFCRKTKKNNQCKNRQTGFEPNIPKFGYAEEMHICNETLYFAIFCEIFIKTE